MSIVSCFFILLILCLSKQDPCKARYNGIFAADDHFHFSGKGVSPIVEKVQVQTDSVDQGTTINGGDGVDDHDRRDRVTTQEHAKKESARARGKFSGGVLRKQTLVYVSWRVLSRKQDKYKNNHNKDKHPGLFSDYSRPRTRPPSHN